MEQQLPFVGRLEAAQRAEVQIVVQKSVTNFIDWLSHPEHDARLGFDSFADLPQDLARALTLRETVDMVRVAMEFFEQWLPALARNESQLGALTEEVLRYGRELGFGAAAAYASAAESRGAWDTRLEALVVDAVVRGDTGSEMASRAAALNWDAAAPATVIIGSPPEDERIGVVSKVHDVARAHRRSALAVEQGPRLVTIVSGPLPPDGRTGADRSFLSELLTVFADGPVVIGPTMPSLGQAHTSAREALIGIHAVPGWESAPRPVFASELLAERALLGDAAAVETMVDRFVRPLGEPDGVLAQTLGAYLESGGAVEACARRLYVHPNTVRYRLKRITEVTGRDPADPRDAFVLRLAVTLGRLTRAEQQSPTPIPGPIHPSGLAPGSTHDDPFAPVL